MLSTALILNLYAKKAPCILVKVGNTFERNAVSHAADVLVVHLDQAFNEISPAFEHTVIFIPISPILSGKRPDRDIYTRRIDITAESAKGIPLHFNL